jgi:hypothetical protein
VSDLQQALCVVGLGPEAQIGIVKETVTAPKIGDHGYGCHFEKDMGIGVISTTITGMNVILP